MNNILKVVSSATSGTVTLDNTGRDIMLFHTGALTATLTIAMPATPIDGQRVTLNTANGITLLSLTAAVGTIIATLTTLAAGVGNTYIYESSTSKWFRF